MIMVGRVSQLSTKLTAFKSQFRLPSQGENKGKMLAVKMVVSFGLGRGEPAPPNRSVTRARLSLRPRSHTRRALLAVGGWSREDAGVVERGVPAPLSTSG